jgi:hypothetical protein
MFFICKYPRILSIAYGDTWSHSQRVHIILSSVMDVSLYISVCTCETIVNVSLKLFKGVFMNYDDLYKLYSLFNNNRSSSENMDWFVITSKTSSERSHITSTGHRLTPSSTVMPQIEVSLPNQKLTKCFPFR